MNFLAMDCFETEVEQTATKLWALMVQKVGKTKAKEIMWRVMDNKKPGPRNPEERLLNFIIEGEISKNAHESDEKIAKRILARKLCFVRYGSGAIGISNIHELQRDDFVEVEDGIATVVEWKPIAKQLKSFKKRIERIRSQMIEMGALAKEYAPRRYYRD